MKKLTRRGVDYVWKNFNKYIFSEKEFLSFYKEVEEIVRADKKSEKLFGNNLIGFWKVFREFRTQKANIFDDALDKHIDFLKGKYYELLPKT